MLVIATLGLVRIAVDITDGALSGEPWYTVVVAAVYIGLFASILAFTLRVPFTGVELTDAQLCIDTAFRRFRVARDEVVAAELVRAFSPGTWYKLRVHLVGGKRITAKLRGDLAVKPRADEVLEAVRLWADIDQRP